MAEDLRSLVGPVAPVFAAVAAAGGSALVVGGAVRDALLGLAPEDIDVEAYGLSPDALAAAVAPLGRVDAVGRAFGVLKLRLPGGRTVDIAVPQRRSANPTGARGHIPEPDPSLTPREALARRDFTWNAMAVDAAGALRDEFGGRRDLRARVIRHTSPAFDEDPLRVLRAVQFAARFDMRLAPETAARCRALLPEAAALPPERVWGEWQKWAARGRRPSAGLRALRESGWLARYPELAALEGCAQDPLWHPEGDVAAHTAHVCDAAAAAAGREGLGADARCALLFAALCHDLGKPTTSYLADDGHIRSPGHAEAGVPLALALLARMGAPRWLGELVGPLVAEHMSLVNVAPTPRAVRRLAVRLAPATVGQWRMLVEADASGRPPYPPADPGAAAAEMAASLGADGGRPAPVVTGRDLMARGYAQGPRLGEALRRAYAAQIEGEFATLEEGLAWIEERSADDADEPDLAERGTGPIRR